MRIQKRTKLHIGWDDALHATECYLIKAWSEHHVEMPASPLEMVSALAINTLALAKRVQGDQAVPSEEEFSRMMSYILEHYALSPEFPCDKQQLAEDMFAKMVAMHKLSHAHHLDTEKKQRPCSMDDDSAF